MDTKVGLDVLASGNESFHGQGYALLDEIPRMYRNDKWNRETFRVPSV